MANLAEQKGKRLSPHGLRAGCIAEAYLKGVPDEQVRHHTRQRRLTTTQDCCRGAKVAQDSPARRPAV